MSQRLINRSKDLLRLRNEGYEIEIRSGYVLIHHVPYVDGRKEIKFGVLVCELTLAGDVTAPPGSHVAYFMGEHPCNRDGSKLARIENASSSLVLANDLTIDHTFSSKPLSGSYKDYYEKVTTYVAIISSPAAAIDPAVTPRTFAVVTSAETDSVFLYVDTATSRAGINVATSKLELSQIAIIGVGGTGSYVLDLVAKTPVKEIHLFDGDALLQHNAFRCPGAPSVDELVTAPKKVTYFAERYSKMRRGIVAHEQNIDETNVDQMRQMNFVFLCMDRGITKQLIVTRLQSFGVPFVDVGMGVELVDSSLRGVLRVTTSSDKRRDHVRTRISFGEQDGADDYDRNIQIAELNALNAALAVIKWKKLYGFYLDLENEHHSTYSIDVNMLTSDEHAA